MNTQNNNAKKCADENVRNEFEISEVLHEECYSSKPE